MKVNFIATQNIFFLITIPKYSLIINLLSDKIFFLKIKII